MSRRHSNGLRGFFACMVLCLLTPTAAHTGSTAPLKFKRVPTQFIAALGDPGARSGDGAEHWGIWRRDPGPRGIRLHAFDRLQAAGGIAPAGWKFDPQDWWVEENGLVMEKPSFPLPPGNYLVTGDRETITVLTVHPADASGTRRWELANGAALYDVTHLPCRSARYVPTSDGTPCSPESAPRAEFPVRPGAVMPEVPGCAKQDYAVLFIIGMPL